MRRSRCSAIVWNIEPIDQVTNIAWRIAHIIEIALLRDLYRWKEDRDGL
jgi:hypothetical protein